MGVGAPLLLLLCLIAPLGARLAIPTGPTYGRDFSGLDYNVTHWKSPASKSANHWQAAALECEALCVADAKCCAWTYCTPEGGVSDPERCCLKTGVPPEGTAATHWTGSPRDGEGTCVPAPPPPSPFTVTNSPACLTAPNCAWGKGARV